MKKNLILFKRNNPEIDRLTFINIEATHNIFEQIKNTNFNEINIYDQTYNPQIKNGEIINVSDHINQTGTNPLIGNQHKLKEPFIDISKLYSNQSGITTNCLGKYYKEKKENYKYPSTHLCVIAIIARVYEKKINGFLVNNL